MSAVKKELVGRNRQTINFLRIEPGNDDMLRPWAGLLIDQRHQGMTVIKIYRPLESGMTLINVFFEAVAITFKPDHAST